MVGDGHRRAGTPLRAAQDEAGVPPGVWKGQGLAALGLAAGGVVSERQAEPLRGEGRDPDADRIEREHVAQGRSPAQARRATVLGRPIDHNRSPKTEKAKQRLPCQAADQTRPPKRTELLSLTELRTRWRRSAIRAYGADVVDRLAVRARAAAAAVWARARPAVDVVLAAAETVAVVYVMRGAFARHPPLAEARRHLAYALHGRPHESGLDERIVQAAVDDLTRPVGRGRRMTADLRALYPGDTEDQAVLRPLTRRRRRPVVAVPARLPRGGSLAAGVALGPAAWSRALETPRDHVPALHQ